MATGVLDSSEGDDVFEVEEVETPLTPSTRAPQSIEFIQGTEVEFLRVVQEIMEITDECFDSAPASVVQDFITSARSARRKESAWIAR
jgi:hypothetical protein